MIETSENRLKRLSIRSHRRGMKEMDVILGGFADRELGNLTASQLDAYEALLQENDQDLYLWVCGKSLPPTIHQATLNLIAASLSK